MQVVRCVGMRTWAGAAEMGGVCSRPHLVDEEHAGRQLGSQAEAGAYISHAVAQPLGRHGGRLDGQEASAALGRARARQQRLARA